MKKVDNLMITAGIAIILVAIVHEGRNIKTPSERVQEIPTEISTLQQELNDNMQKVLDKKLTELEMIERQIEELEQQHDEKVLDIQLFQEELENQGLFVDYEKTNSSITYVKKNQPNYLR